MKQVLLLVIDALTAPSLIEEMANGRYPNFQKVKNAGVLREQCVSIFPSITHAALTSIITGKYPEEHGIIGSHWYDIQTNKVHYFSGSPGMMLKQGIANFFMDFLLGLNNEHLQALTLFQKLERNGRKTACINFPIYRGDVPHEVNMPLLLQWLPNLPKSTTVKGPTMLLLGDLLTNPDSLDIEAAFTGLANWFGFHDKNSIDLLLQIANKNQFPDFTLAYFPENDETAHRIGPREAHQNLANLDEMLGKLFDIYGGIDPFLEQFTLIITGDHSQSETAADPKEEAIDLSQTLANYRLAEPGRAWNTEDEIMICPNLRAALLYFQAPTPEWVQTVLETLLEEPRIDQLIYSANLVDKGDGFVVQTANGRLQFWPDPNSSTQDNYGNHWAWEGDLSVVDGRLQNNQLTFPNYPNAFERIAGALNCRTNGQLWLTAKIGHELIGPLMKAYTDGGSHASLHRLDSQPPLIVAGAPQSVTIPQHPRIIDIAPLCQTILMS